MNKFLERLLKRNAKNNTVAKEEMAQNQQTQQTQQPKYDFVEKYVLIDPKRVMGSYDYWSSCDTVPAAIEDSENKGGLGKCVELPTKLFLNYLVGLKNAPIELSQSLIARTVYVIHLQNNESMYIYPNLQDIKTPWVALSNRKTWPFDVTPNINRAIVDAMKTYTRAR